MIAGLVCAIHEAKRVRDMRKYPFWARGAGCIGTMRSIAPRKILRDSPAACRTPKKNDEGRGNEEAGVFGSKF